MNIMNRSVKNALIVLLLASGLGCGTNASAADPRAQTQQPSKGILGKVLIVDLAAKAITVDVRGTIHLLWLSSDVKVSKDGKDGAISDIVPGQTVSFQTKKTARGDVDVVTEVTIESSDAETEAAGKAHHTKVVKTPDPIKGGPKDKEKGNSIDRGQSLPPIFPPPPVLRPVVSPHN